MPFAETKVYFDGSHYIAIPHTECPKRRRKKNLKIDIEKTEEEKSATVNLKEKFDELYKEKSNKKRAERKQEIIAEMKPHFKNENDTELFVIENIERKNRNKIVRKTRLARKVNLQQWNYFCTFTYDSKKHTEETFRTKLTNCLRHLSHRKQWKYIGVWERSPEKQRLHFHGIFYIPEMTGELKEVTDYSLNTHRRQTTLQNTYFNERFGRSDFEPITDRTLLGNATAYLMKYIEKSGEKLVYSRGLPTYFISDIMEEDIVCPIGQEDKKLLLFDDFTCWDEGCKIGEVSPETIQQLRKSN